VKRASVRRHLDGLRKWKPVRVLRAEVQRLIRFEDEHHLLLVRLGLLFAASVLLDAVGAISIYFLERGVDGTEVKSFGDALFFSTTQLLTVSSQIKNPLTSWGRVVDVVLEVWAVTVVAASAGAIAAFFHAGDSRSGRNGSSPLSSAD
jgi:ion channel